MSDIWIDRLSEYLDGELNEVDREAIEQHLTGCIQCRSTLEQLRAVVQRAGAMPDKPPERNIWNGIASRINADAPTTPGVVDIETRRSGRRVITFSLPQLVAAGIALMVLSACTGWLVRPGDTLLVLPLADAIVRDAT
ncbi:MAG: zf-HC2 domain-containing protein, partial [Gemmatimonadales bacterium]